MKQSLNISPTQSLTMTPALQQAINMLQMSTASLRAEIQSALDSNLMLESDDGNSDSDEETPESTGDDTPDAGEVNVEWEQIYEPSPSSSNADLAPGDEWQTNTVSTESLSDHLHWQADMAPFDPHERAAATVIIDAIGISGRIEDWLSIADSLDTDFGLDADAAESTLQRIQTFDPPGVAARNLDECISLQLAQYDSDTPGHGTAFKLIREVGLEALANAERYELAQTIDTPANEIDAALALIRTCRPDPGEAYEQSTAEFISPEIEIHRTTSGWQVSLNNDTIPRVRLNERYLELIKRGDQSDDQTTLKNHLQEARCFLNSLKSRNETLLEVAECLVTTQRAFLDYGDKALKPLVLRDVAERLDMHESTVSRATANKYIQTPRGILEMKSFFSSRVPTTDGGAVSGVAIQAMLQSIIAEETPSQPFSDSKLTTRLHDEGVCVARRTVAKYRAALGIAPSRERRR
ncbi:RNA polymerase factor sigma-54 [Salinisphaera sp. USBA-960]|nr:RNA polymerase factor sigma-54 [Salifodinibacter halophilus]NNC26784.1 RNA polymerase factor sigma-54 [Salifodinibacter halophilus]